MCSSSARVFVLPGAVAGTTTGVSRGHTGERPRQVVTDVWVWGGGGVTETDRGREDRGREEWYALSKLVGMSRYVAKMQKKRSKSQS